MFMCIKTPCDVICKYTVHYKYTLNPDWVSQSEGLSEQQQLLSGITNLYQSNLIVFNGFVMIGLAYIATFIPTPHKQVEVVIMAVLVLTILQ